MDKIPWKECEEERSLASDYLKIANSYFCVPSFGDQVESLRLKLLTAALDENVESEPHARFSVWRVLNSEWAALYFGNNESGESFLWESEESDRRVHDELVRQIGVDVERSYNFLDSHLALSPTELSSRRRILKSILIRLFDCPEVGKDRLKLEYLQGAHEICAVILDVWRSSKLSQESGLVAEGKERNVSMEGPGEDGSYFDEEQTDCETEEILEFMADFFITRLSCLHSSLALDVGLYMSTSIMLELLREKSISVFERLCIEKHNVYRAGWCGDGSELHFGIPWLATLFAHTIKSFETLLLIWDVLMCFPPPFLLYFCCSLIEFVVDDLQSLQDNRMKLRIENSVWRTVILPRALELLVQYPYDNLFVGVWEDLSRVRMDKNLNYYDAQETPYIHLAEMSVLPPLYAPILESVRPISEETRRETSAETRGFSCCWPSSPRILAKRASARVLLASGVKGWCCKVLEISKEWRWLADF